MYYIVFICIPGTAHCSTSHSSSSHSFSPLPLRGSSLHPTRPPPSLVPQVSPELSSSFPTEASPGRPNSGRSAFICYITFPLTGFNILLCSVHLLFWLLCDMMIFFSGPIYLVFCRLLVRLSPSPFWGGVREIFFHDFVEDVFWPFELGFFTSFYS